MVNKISTAYFNLIGVPYEKMNCWHLVKRFYEMTFQITLENYCYENEVPREKANKLITSNKGFFKEVTIPSFGDILTINLFGVESHIAVYLGEGKILHTSKANGCHIDSFEKWKKCIAGIYRHDQTETKCVIK